MVRWFCHIRIKFKSTYIPENRQRSTQTSENSNAISLMLFHHCDFLHFSRDQLSRWIPSLSSSASAASELFICINEKDFWVLAATAIIIRNFFGLFSLAAAALLSPFSMHEINSLFYTLSLLCIAAASERTSPFPQKPRKRDIFPFKTSVGLIFSRFYNQTHLHFFFWKVAWQNQKSVLCLCTWKTHLYSCHFQFLK